VPQVLLLLSRIVPHGLARVAVANALSVRDLFVQPIATQPLNAAPAANPTRRPAAISTVLVELPSSGLRRALVLGSALVRAPLAVPSTPTTSAASAAVDNSGSRLLRRRNHDGGDDDGEVHEPRFREAVL
jgi:hypothetical protein